MRVRAAEVFPRGHGLAYVLWGQDVYHLIEPS